MIKIQNVLINDLKIMLALFSNSITANKVYWDMIIANRKLKPSTSALRREDRGGRVSMSSKSAWST